MKEAGGSQKKEGDPNARNLADSTALAAKVAAKAAGAEEKAAQEAAAVAKAEQIAKLAKKKKEEDTQLGNLLDAGLSAGKPKKK